MRVSCPQCGAANDAAPGSKTICVDCTQIFDVTANPDLVSGLELAGPLRTVRPPDLGPEVESEPVALAPPRTDPYAIVSLVSGILFCIPFFGSTVALFMGFKSLNRINADPDTYSGKPLAIAGIVLGAGWWIFAVIDIVSGIVAMRHHI